MPTHPTSWQPLYKPLRSRRCLDLALDIAGRFADAGIVGRAVASARASSSQPASIYWHPYAVAQGDAGVALMFGCFDACFPEKGWDRVAHEWVERASQGAEKVTDVSSGLFEGLSGLAFAVAYLSHGERRYRNLLQRLHDCVVEEARARCEAFDSDLGAIPFLAWDLIAGLTGIGAYLLSRRADEALIPILEHLVALTHDAQGLPRWHTPAASMPNGWMRDTYPEGHLNCGLAHGIPGPLALLSLARIEGVVTSGMVEAIDRIASWLSSHCLTDEWGVNWPSAVPLVRRGDRLAIDTRDDLEATHAAWCYGSPGVARSLWLAGRARSNRAYRALALDAMMAIQRRPPEARMIASPALCHGFAGLLCITLRFRNEVPDRRFTSFGRALLRNLEVMHEPDTLLGYRTTEPGGGRVEQAGFLDGSPGIAMTLLAAATPNPPTWDRLFLLS